MAVIEWHERWNVGIEDIDRQHKNLFDMINKNLRNLRDTADAQEAGTFIDLMLEYVRSHFVTEEHHMLKEGYDKLKYHRQKHIELTERVLSFRNRYLCDNTVDVERLISFIDRWVASHVKNDDQDFGRYLQSRLIRNL